MTISATPRKAGPYVGNGSVSQYSFAFKVFSATHLLVVEANATGAETTLIPVTDYTVALNPNQDTSPGGTVTRTAGALPLNYRWTLLSNAPYSQTMDLPTGGAFSAGVVENATDSLAIQIQQAIEQVSRAVLVPPTSGTDPQVLVNTLTAGAASATADAASAANSASAAAVGNGGRYSATVGGTADAITLTPSLALGSYVPGEAITFIVASTNTGAVSVNVSGLGAKEVTKTGSTALVAGELVAGQIVTLRYDGTRYKIVSPAGGHTQVLVRTDAGGVGPIMACYHDSASPAALDVLGLVRYKGNNSAAGVVNYGDMRMAIANPAAGSETANFQWWRYQAGVESVALVLGAGLFTTAASGGDKGAGTANFSAVYDDNVLLTCYAIEHELTGKVTKKRWDDATLNLDVKEEGGNVRTEVRKHAPAARFAARAAEMLDPKTYGQSWKATGHLAAMPSPAEWEAAGKKMGLGDLQQRLWETVEVQAIHIDKLLTRIEALENKP